MSSGIWTLPRASITSLRFLLLVGGRSPGTIGKRAASPPSEQLLDLRFLAQDLPVADTRSRDGAIREACRRWPVVDLRSERVCNHTVRCR